MRNVKSMKNNTLKIIKYQRVYIAINNNNRKQQQQPQQQQQQQTSWCLFGFWQLEPDPLGGYW